MTILEGVQEDLAEFVHAACDHPIHTAGHQKVEGGNQGGFARGFVLGYRNVGPLNVQLDRSPSGGSIQDEIRKQEGLSGTETAAQEAIDIFLRFALRTKGGSRDNRGSLRGGRDGRRCLGVLDREMRRPEQEAREPVHAAELRGLNDLAREKPLDESAETAGGCLVGVDATGKTGVVIGKLSDAGLAAIKSPPNWLHAGAQRRDQARARDDNGIVHVRLRARLTLLPPKP